MKNVVCRYFSQHGEHSNQIATRCGLEPYTPEGTTYDAISIYVRHLWFPYKAHFELEEWCGAQDAECWILPVGRI